MFDIAKGFVLSDFYKLPCSCGLFVPVEKNQAGREVKCSCGESLQVPSMSQIKNLEPLSEKEKQVTKPLAATSLKVNDHSLLYVKSFVLSLITALVILATYFGFDILRGQGLVSIYVLAVDVILIITAVFVIRAKNFQIRAKHVCLFFGIVSFFAMGLMFLRGIQHYPQLYDVCTMNPYYVHDGKVVGRDTLPISPRDFRLMVDERIVPRQYVIMTEDVINQHPFYDQAPIRLIELHDILKGGLELSYNFHEKYDQLVFYYWARFVVFGALTIAALVLIIVGLFLPKQTEDIGERGGEAWE